MAILDVSSDQTLTGSDVLEDEFEYRPLSSSAIASAVFGALSLLMFVAGKDSLQSCLMLAPLPMIGLTVGLRALARFHAMPGQMSGWSAALGGVVLSAFGLVGGLSYAGYVHATEVPQGYMRTSFQEFRPDEVEQRGGVLVPEKVRQLHGQKVFIKGYMRPGTAVTKEGTPVRRHAGRFLLVRDNNECCFGDQSKLKYYDQVLVTMAGSKTADESRGLLRVGGTLQRIPSTRQREGMPIYLLEADYLQ